MNAVETEKLFAAADNDPAINFKEGKPDQLKTATALHQPLPKKRLKQKK